MAVTSRKRKVLFWLAAFLVVVAVALTTSPWWLPLALRPILKSYGITYATYQRQGFSRLILTDVVYGKKRARFTTKRAEFFQPIVWMWEKQFGPPPRPDFATASDWSLVISETQKEGARKSSLVSVLEKTDVVLPQIKSWLPTAILTNGQFHLAGETVSIPSLSWDRGLVKARAASEKHRQTVAGEIWFSTEPKQIHLRSDSADLDLYADIHREKTSARLEGIARWNTNRVELAAEFPDEGWKPLHATAKTANFRVPAERLKLKGYHDLVAAFDGQWTGREFEIDLSAQARPERSSLPVVRAEVRATGTTNRARIEQAKISAPWMKAELSENVELDFSGQLLSPEAKLSVAIDLSQQSFFKASGQFSGEAFLRRNGKKYPNTTFHLSAVAFEGFGINARKVQFKGKLDWPSLEVQSLQAELAEGGTVEAGGNAELALKQIVNARLKLGGDFGRKFLPPEISYTNFVMNAQFSGPFRQPSHSGHVEIHGFTVPALAATTLVGDWRGQLLNFEQLDLKATAKRSSLAVGLSGNFEQQKTALHLRTLTLTRLGQAFLILKEPARIMLAKGSDPKSHWQIQAEKIAWQGGTRQFAVEGTFDWPVRGKFSASVKQLNSLLFQDFFRRPLPNVKVEALDLAGAWTNGPLSFVLRGTGEWQADETNAFAAEIRSAGDENGIAFEELKILSESNPVITGRGFLPIRLHPARTNKIELRPHQLVDFRADTLPHSVFWERLSEWSRVRFADPQLHFIVTGTLEKPRGKLSASAARVEWIGRGSENNLPELRDLRATIDLTEERAVLKNLTVLLEGQPLAAEAELPLGKESLQNWKTALDWRKASGHIYANEIEFAPFVRFAPKYLAPQGKLSLNLSFSPGWQLDGILKIVNAASRPLPGSGPLHDVQAEILFIGHRVELEDVHGFLGGQPIGLFGSVDFGRMFRNFPKTVYVGKPAPSPSFESKQRPIRDAAGSTSRPADKSPNLPLIDLRLIGKNVPLARNPDVIMRADLELFVSNATNEAPVVSGEVKLRDSFYLGDLKQLLPGRVASVKKRPPYFSIDAWPLADWTLAVQVTGTDFMKVRSPLFRGAITADLKLSGTLREPVALGDAKIGSGLIQFPFANFKVTQGFVSLTSDDPYRPHLFVTATSRAFGYDLQLSLRGPADEPIIEFTSTPALSSEQIILMITTGEIPKKAFSFSQEQKAQKLALFVGKSLLSKFSADEGGAERLNITSGEDISEKGRETYSLEYKLTDDWSIVGEYDRFGALNAGVKWRVYSK